MESGAVAKREEAEHLLGPEGLPLDSYALLDACSALTGGQV
jgi:hypothetical protein